MRTFIVLALLGCVASAGFTRTGPNPATADFNEQMVGFAGADHKLAKRNSPGHVFGPNPKTVTFNEQLAGFAGADHKLAKRNSPGHVFGPNPATANFNEQLIGLIDQHKLQKRHAGKDFAPPRDP